MKRYWDSMMVDGVEIFIQVNLERRSSIRTSFGKDYIIVRMPRLTPKIIQKVNLAKAKEWVKSSLKSAPMLINRYKIRNYSKNNVLSVMGSEMVVNIDSQVRKSGKGIIKGNNLSIILPDNVEGHDKRVMVRTLISRTLAKHFPEKIQRMVDNINDAHFHEDIKSINLKYNTSNWGSCSTLRNINLSTRLLLAPKWVIEYVIIHEMSHLREMNHSAKFWAIVEKACPEYRNAEQWLKDFGNECYF